MRRALTALSVLLLLGLVLWAYPPEGAPVEPLLKRQNIHDALGEAINPSNVMELASSHGEPAEAER